MVVILCKRTQLRRKSLSVPLVARPLHKQAGERPDDKKATSLPLLRILLFSYHLVYPSQREKSPSYHPSSPPRHVESSGAQQGVLVISPTPAGLMSEMLGSTPAAPSSAGSADNVARERIAMATEGQARVSPLSGAGHSRAPSVSHQEPTVSSRAEMPAASIALVRRQQQRMANFSLQCFMKSIGEMSSREMWKLEFFLDSVLDAAHKAEFGLAVSLASSVESLFQ